MTFYRTLTLTTSLALLTGPAFADLTAEEVLADQLRQMEAYGLTATPTGQSRNGNTLSVSGLIARAATDQGTFSMTIGGADFVEQGDGTVAVIYPTELPLTVSGKANDGEDFEMGMTIKMTGVSNVASGSTDLIRYDFAAEAFQLSDVQFMAPEEAKNLDMEISMLGSGMSGFIELGAGEVRNYNAIFAMDAMDMVVGFADPEGSDGTFALNFSIANLAADYVGAMAKQNLMESFAVAVMNGNRVKGSFQHGQAGYSILGNGPDGQFQMDARAASGNLSFTMDETGLDYDTVSRDVAVNFGGTMMPLPPMGFTAAETGGRFSMPIIPGEDPQDFALRFALGDVKLDDMIWGMFDPAGQLPRDAINLVLDLDGKVVLTEDIFDPNAMEEMTAPPGQINSANLNELRLSIGGADLTGDGAFTFNNEFGIPIPAGVVNLMLVGGNGLMDKLVAMGLLPAEQAMGARMMMGMFARPGDGEDTLVSTIEMKEDGSILANGQRIK